MTNVNFTVSIDEGSTRRQIQKEVQQAIQERDDYLASDDFREFCKQQAKVLEA